MKFFCSSFVLIVLSLVTTEAVPAVENSFRSGFVKDCELARKESQSEAAKTLQVIQQALRAQDNPLPKDYPCSDLWELAFQKSGWLLSEKKITDLRFFKYLPNTEMLALSKNQITDITVLSDLFLLRHLDLSHNPLTDDKIKKVGTLKRLVFLNVSHTKITHLDWVQNSELRSLLVSNTSITQFPKDPPWRKTFEIQARDTPKLKSIDALQNLPKLRKLWVGFTKPSPNTPPMGLAKLNKNLNSLHLNHRPLKLETIPALSDIAWNYLGLGGTGLEQVPDLKLKERQQLILDLSYNPKLNSIEKFVQSASKHLRSIRTLNLSATGLRDESLKCLESLDRLDDLYLAELQLSQIPKLKYVLNLGVQKNRIRVLDPKTIQPVGLSLNISGNQISDLRPLNGRRFLTLNISDNPISSFEGVEKLVASTLVWQKSSEKAAPIPEDLSALNDMGIWNLYLNGQTNFPFNKLKDMEVLKKLMRHFDCISCGLKDVSFLSAFPKLTWVTLSKNDIRSLTPLSKLTQLHTVKIDNNPLGSTIKATEENCPKETKSRGLRSLCERLQKKPLPD